MIFKEEMSIGIRGLALDTIFYAPSGRTAFIIMLWERML
jgi:hypothetical protein